MDIKTFFGRVIVFSSSALLMTILGANPLYSAITGGVITYLYSTAILKKWNKKEEHDDDLRFL